MSFQEFRNKLLQRQSADKIVLNAALIDSDNIIKLFNSTLGIREISVNSVQVADQDRKLIITGKTSFLNIQGMPVEIKIADDKGGLNISLAAQLPDSWTFDQSFPNLSPYFNYSSLNYGYKPSFLKGLAFSKPAFVLTTHPFKDYASNVELERGLNFIARMDPFSLLEEWKLLSESTSPILVSGLVSSDTPMPEFCLNAQIPLGLGDDGNVLKFENVQLKLWSSLIADHPVPAGLEINTQLKVAGKTLEIFSPLRMGAPLSFIVIGGRFSDIPLPDLGKLSHLVGGNDLESSLPPSLRSFGGLTIEEIVTGFSLVKSELAYVRACIRTTNSWTVIPNLFQINDLVSNWYVESPLKPTQRRLYCELAGQIEIADVAFNLYAKWPNFLLSGGLASGNTIKLGALLNHFVPDIPAPDDRLVISQLQLLLNPTAKTYEIGAYVESLWAFEIGNKTLSIDALSLSLAKTQKQLTGFLAGSLSFQLAGNIGKVLTLDLKSELPASSASGWQFSGQTGHGQNIRIDELIVWLEQSFGSVPPPSAIQQFNISNLGIRFNTHSKDFFFTCEGNFTLPGLDNPLQVIVTIDIKHQHDGSFTKVFAGSLIIDGIEFDIMFESSHEASGNDSQTFIASYYDKNGHAIEIDGILKAISRDAPSTGIGINIKDGLFAYQASKSGQTSQSKYLLGLDIDAGLDLSNLQLPDLPLIGQLFPPGQTLKLGLQVLYPNKSFNPKEIEDLNALSKGFNFPQNQEVNDLKLVTLLHVGEETKPLDLPIALGTNQNQKVLVDSPKPPGTPDSDGAVVAAKVGNTKWIKIQKTFGPIHIERVGIGYEAQKIQLLLDSALSAAGLTLSLDGLGAEFALTDLTTKTFNPHFHLDGLGIDYKNGSLEIAGSFLRHEITLKDQDNEKSTSFAGLAIVRTAKLSLSAIGSYTQIKHRDPSLFVYAVANYPLGGPSFFFVTGFAAGFGYNRSLILPTLDQVATFPLVAEALESGGPNSLPADKDGQRDTLTKKLESLENYLPPSSGEIFVAAGVKFNSFKQIDSFALLALKFGRHFEIDLLGQSTLTTPPPSENSKTVAPLAQAQLVLKASFVPDEGLLAVRAQLTPNSYILSKDCQLSGGFAFYSWFDPHPNAGDFVLTLGGYHPNYKVPEHYPQVPRLAVNWQVSTELHVKADAYFALTGSALMAGGHLQAVWQHDKLKAWFNAGADFIVAWQPYHYDASLYIDIGVSYTFEIFGNHTLSVDLGADLHLWGPEFCGEATVHWSVISFTVRFGNDTPQALDPIEWKDFNKAFLPQPEQICTINVQKGLVRQIPANQKENDDWIVNAKEMVLAVNSAIPITEGSLSTNPDKFDGKAVAIAAMGIDVSKPAISTMLITVTRDGTATPLNGVLKLSPIWKAMPAGLWGKPNLTDDRKHLRPPKLNGEQLVDNMLAGFEIRPIKKEQQANSLEIERDALQSDAQPVPTNIKWHNIEISGKRGKEAWKAAKTVADKREELQKLCQVFGLVDTVVDFGEPVSQALSTAA